MALPHIAFPNAGRQRYFLHALAAAARFGHVHVLELGPTTEPAEFEACRAAYVHLSGKSVTYELEWCIGRYFVLRDWMKSKQIGESWMLDSDVVVVDFLPDMETFPPGTCCALSFDRNGHPLDHHASAHCSFWTFDALESFCTFVTDIYRTRAQDLRALYRDRQAKGIRSAISDMTLLYLWARDRADVIDLHDWTAGGLIDHNMRALEQPRGVTLKGRAGNKALTVRPDGVFCETVEGELLRLRALHFQGRAKILISDFVRGSARGYALKAAARHGWDRLRRGLRPPRVRPRAIPEQAGTMASLREKP
jgi:hypothetical protein